MPVDSSLLGAILSSAGAGTALICVLLLTGILATRVYVQRLEKEADSWRAAYEAERAARATDHDATEELRRAVVAQTQRADAAVEVMSLALLDWPPELL